MARHLPCPVRPDAAPPCRAGGADERLHHPGQRRPAPPAQAGDGGRAHRPQALGTPGADGHDPALEGPRPDAGPGDGGGGGRLCGRAVAQPVCGVPDPLEAAQHGGLRRPVAAHDGDPADAAGHPGRLPPAVPLYPGGRVPGYEPGAIPLATAAGAGAQEHLLRRRRRPVPRHRHAGHDGGRQPATHRGRADWRRRAGLLRHRRVQAGACDGHLCPAWAAVLNSGQVR